MKVFAWREEFQVNEKYEVQITKCKLMERLHFALRNLHFSLFIASTLMRLRRAMNWIGGLRHGRQQVLHELQQRLVGHRQIDLVSAALRGIGMKTSQHEVTG